MVKFWELYWGILGSGGRESDNLGAYLGIFTYVDEFLLGDGAKESDILGVYLGF